MVAGIVRRPPSWVVAYVAKTVSGSIVLVAASRWNFLCAPGYRIAMLRCQDTNALVRFGMSKISTTESIDGATDTDGSSPKLGERLRRQLRSLKSKPRLWWCAVATCVIGSMAILSVGYVFIRETAVPPTEERQPTAAERFEEQFAVLQNSKETVARLDAFTIDDAMLKKLASIDRLTTIQVKADTVSLDTIATLSKLPKLEQLHVRGAAINDEMLAELASSSTIWLLNFSNAMVSPTGIEALAKMPTLRQLRLGIKDGDNRHGRAVATLSRLRAVHLIRVAVTDEGLHALAKMPQLESLYLDDSAITDAGWTWLFENNPQLHVHINQKHHDRDPQKH
jgi:hypothetical protein